MIGSSVNRPAMIKQAFKRDGQIFACWIVDGKVVQASRTGSRLRPVLALPGVEANVVMVATGGEKSSSLQVEEQIEAQVVSIEFDSTVQVGNFKVDVSDACLG